MLQWYFKGKLKLHKDVKPLIVRHSMRKRPYSHIPLPDQAVQKQVRVEQTNFQARFQELYEIAQFPSVTKKMSWSKKQHSKKLLKTNLNSGFLPLLRLLKIHRVSPIKCLWANDLSTWPICVVPTHAIRSLISYHLNVNNYAKHET